MIEGREIMGTRECAAMLGLAPYTVRNMAKRGSIPGAKVGRSWRFLRSEILEVLSKVDQYYDIGGRARGEDAQDTIWLVSVYAENGQHYEYQFDDQPQHIPGGPQVKFIGRFNGKYFSVNLDPDKVVTYTIMETDVEDEGEGEDESRIFPFSLATPLAGRED